MLPRFVFIYTLLNSKQGSVAHLCEVSGSHRCQTIRGASLGPNEIYSGKGISGESPICLSVVIALLGSLILV